MITVPKQRSQNSRRSERTGPSETYHLRYSRPKVFLIDIEDEAARALKEQGYNVSIGSFGAPYRVPKSDKFVPVIVNGDIPPDFGEQEIVVVDICPRTVLDKCEGEKHTPPGENDWWAGCNKGKVDPRPRMMAWMQKKLDRILSHGGVFLIFGDSRETQKVVWAHKDHYDILRSESDIHHDNWCFLSVLSSLDVRSDLGKEINVVANNSEVGKLLLGHIRDASFLCTLYPRPSVQRGWTTLANNKYGAPVAGTIVPEKEGGWVFIFPRIKNKPEFLAELFKTVLPDLTPHLFPEVEGARWVQRREYELPTVRELKDKIQIVQEDARKQIVDLEKAIEEERRELGFLHDLLRETGQPLVATVKKTLEVLGFQSVLDVDEEMKKVGDTGPKREDLQIRDNSPILLVEVKGISGLPKDTDSLQVWKYVAPRMREWNRTDIQGLSIINHQRNLPALDRGNRTPFREDILTNAKDQKFGLLTTWDLFRLTRSYLKNRWQHEHIRSLFSNTGRIEPIPSHYEFIGVVEHYWEKAEVVGVRVKAVDLKLRDRISFELPVEFEEQDVGSLEVENKPEDKAEIGMLAGIKTYLAKEQAKKGIRVFRVKKA